MGTINTEYGLVPVVSPDWSHADRWGHIRSRMSAFRMNYAINPGLYAIGTPDADSDIFVSANYKFSFDILRRELMGINGWILVLDTKGINVWCAAGKGTFGTDELVRRITAANLAGLVAHRRIIVPQLGATGVRATEVMRKTGFHVYFGPVEAADIKQYCTDNYRASPEMRQIRFGIVKRLILTPIELNQALKRYPLVALIILVIFGLQPTGVIFNNAWFEGWPYLFLCLIAIVIGAVITPLLLPFIPGRSFALKGLITGVAAVSPLVALTPAGGESFFLKASALVLFSLLSSYLALQFTGATTFTTISGVKKELRIWLPIYIAGLVIAAILLVLYKIHSWGLI
ncbi:MAG: hypothetical protein A2176_09680 [Spirochaetes bacterium RBG_13_51_14]|nr:MAG: hypothetical protein A2176_09680 [Spirochaetes bacterium RBG_13_51_14]